jgi:SH3-like domain-containing protein
MRRRHHPQHERRQNSQYHERPHEKKKRAFDTQHHPPILNWEGTSTTGKLISGVPAGSITRVNITAVLLLIFGGCAQGPPPARPIGEAFVGPAALKIRADIALQSATVTTVKHGERLQILQTKRRFLRVRTESGAEGWTDDRQLLAAADMTALRELTASAAKMPSLGVATTYAPLNIHTQPAVSSPSFLQLKENERFDVLQSVLFPRSDAARAPLIPPTPKKAKALPKKETKKPKIPPPPMPKPPPPPADWLELSKSERDEAAAEAGDVPPAKAAPRLDGWSLIRASNGQAGWVLTRLVSMAIPDEVAQYAEGKRIVSYFPLGEISDGDEKKKIWLWATTGDSKQPWDFDSFRVFVWSLRHHRYETAYIERNLKGFSPILHKQVDFASKAQSGKFEGFSICMEKKDGQRARREYAVLGTAIRFAGEQACEPPQPPITAKSPAPIPVTGAPDAAATESLTQRLKKRWHKLIGK